MFKEVNDAIKWMEERRFITKGMDAFKAYMKKIGNPQDEIPCIHIAGTNGKGSTLNYLRSVLQTAGYQVGTFSSPYIETHFDRIRINDINIDPTFFLTTVNEHYQEWIHQKLNMFEIDFVIATLYFQYKKIDFAIYEVGLGGRKDATNLVHPLLSIITNIGMDHMELLGDTYEKIAYEKAGIIKEKTPLITAEKKPECIRIFSEQCRLNHSLMKPIEEAQNISNTKELSFQYRTFTLCLQDTPLYQIENIGCVIETILYLQQQHIIKITSSQMIKGITQSHWKGRFEMMSRNPLVIVDGAHNLEGIKALCSSMKGYTDIHILFSALKDKDHDQMLETLFSISDDITVCEFGFYRGTTCRELAKQYPVKMEKDFRMAIDQEWGKKGTILITGSLYFISEVRKYIQTKT